MITSVAVPMHRHARSEYLLYQIHISLARFINVKLRNMEEEKISMEIVNTHSAGIEVGNLKESIPLRDFFQRINFREGRVSAISATARKLAVIIRNMLVNGTPYYKPAG